jgi:protein tyrosine/serine phosphatase
LVTLLLIPTLSPCIGNDDNVRGVLPGNFHAIEEGKAYRSAQPNPLQLANAIEAYDIKTVINLRGPNPGEPWYDRQIETCEAMNVEMIDHPMSASKLPHPKLIKEVIETLKTAERPVLMHCQGGADRSGATAAIYRMLIQGHDREAAFEELSPRYMHFRAFKPCMDTLIEVYEPTDDWLIKYTGMYDTLECKP